MRRALADTVLDVDAEECGPSAGLSLIAGDLAPSPLLGALVFGELARVLRLREQNMGSVRYVGGDPLERGGYAPLSLGYVARNLGHLASQLTRPPLVGCSSRGEIVRGVGVA